MVPPVVIVEAGGGGGYPSAAAVGLQAENCIALTNAGGFVDDRKSSLCDKHAFNGYSTVHSSS